MTRTPLAILGLVALTACRRPPVAPVPDAVVAAADAGRHAADAPADAIADAPDAPTPSTGGALQATCAALTAASLAQWDAVVRAHGSQSVPVIYEASRRAEVRRRWECVRVPEGAWALSLEARSLAVVFVRPDGTTARATPPGCANDPTIPGFQGTALGPQPGVTGSASVVVTCDNARGAVVSVTPDGLAVAPLPFGGVDVRLGDVDRDGLLDVMTDPERAGGVTFVAHALPAGGFSLDDEVTRVVLRGQCPERPGALRVAVRPDVVDDDDPNRADAVARRVACARVWRVPVAELVAQIEADGGEPSSRASLRALASLRPPQHLRPVALPAVTDGPVAEPRASTETAAPASGADAGAPAWPRAVARACEAAAARVRRLTEAEITRAGESLTDAGTDTIDGRPVARRMGIVRRSLGRCVAAAGGAWVLALRSVTRDAVEAEARVRFRARWAADFVTTEGVRIDGGERGALVDEGCDHDELDAFASSDLDGDGRGELAVGGTHTWCGDGDGDDPIPVTVLTARGDRVAPYAPFAAVGVVESFVDFDRDGRLDFIDGERWGRVACDPAAVGVDESSGPRTLWHTRPDGTFARDDAVTRAYLRRGSCATPPRRLYAAPVDDGDAAIDGTGALFQAVCARAHGWSIERVQWQALAELRARGPERARFRCNDVEWLSWRILVGLPTEP